MIKGSTEPDRGFDARRRLLRAAAELVTERGWEAVSTRVLADRAGVTAGVVHYHFGSVQALLAEAAVGVMRTVFDDLALIIENAESPGDALDLLLASLDPGSGRDPVSVLFFEAYLAATRDENLRRDVRAIVAGFRRRFAAWLGEHGVQAPEATAALLTAAIDGVVLHRALDPGVSTARLAPVLRRIPTTGRTSKERAVAGD